MHIDDNWEIHPEVKRLFEKYRDEMFFWHPDADYSPNDKRFYVYIWFTSDEGKIFYVGKGTRSRVKHILKEIEECEKDARKCKGKRYKQLKDRHGIEYRILLDKLSDFEAQIYEFCLMREYNEQGEVLLNFADMPYIEENFTPIESPRVFKDKFYERYFGDYSTPIFDTVTPIGLTHVYLHDSFIAAKNIYEDRERIISWVESSGGKVYSSRGKQAKSVIVFGEYPYEKYIQDHNEGRQVYNAFDVLTYIVQNTPAPNKKGVIQASVPNYDLERREEMKNYLVSIGDRIDFMASSRGNGYEEQITGYELKKAGKHKEAMLYFYVAVKKGWNLPELYIQLGILLRKYGLFDEEVKLLKYAINNCDFNDACLSRVSDRLKKAEQILIADSGGNK